MKAESVRDSGESTTPSGRPVEEVLREADAAFERGDLRSARLLYEQALALDPGSVHALRRLARLEAVSGEMKAAAANYRRALALSPGDLDLEVDLASSLTAKSDLDEAIARYRSLRAAHPDDPRILLGLAQALTKRRRYAQADAVLRDMEERHLEPIRARLARAGILVLKRDFEGAERFFRAVLQADPGNLEARLGLADAQHRQGLDRAALHQADNIVLDHPESAPARALQEDIHFDLKPRVHLDPEHRSDDDNRVDSAVAGYTFMAEPQTAVRIDFETRSAEFRCENGRLCDERFASPPPAVADERVSADAQSLLAGTTSRLLRPLTIEAQAGAVRQEPFGGGARTIAVASGSLRWQVGPRFALTGRGGREALLDTARLIDRGLKIDHGEGSLEYVFHVDWTLVAHGGYASYSDRNARETAGLELRWRLPWARPRVTAAAGARFRRFHDDRDNGYFDPLRHDAEVLTTTVEDDALGGRISWRVQAAYGRQDFDEPDRLQEETRRGGTVKGFAASFGVGLGGRAGLEAFYSRSDDALLTATGLTTSRAGLLFRLRP